MHTKGNTFQPAALRALTALPYKPNPPYVRLLESYRVPAVPTRLF